MKLKIFKKLFFTTACVLFVTLTLVFLLVSVETNNEFAKNSYTVQNNACNYVADALSSENANTSALSAIESIANVNELDLFVADSNGHIVLCGCADFAEHKNCSHTNTLLGTDTLEAFSAEDDLQLSTLEDMYESLNYVVVKKTSFASEKAYYVISASSSMNVSQLLKAMLGTYALAAIFPLLFMFVAEYSIVYRITRPLKYMSIAAKSIANGDFTKRVPVMSNDEIGELSILFNRMTDSLAHTEITSKSFVANVSHELKTPMTTISGFIDGIIDGTIDETKREHYLRIVSDEVKRLSRLVQSMLSITKLESGENPIKPTSFRLSELVLNTVISMEQKITAKNINIVGLDMLTETVISGDKDLLHQVVYNLTDNAVKFTQQDGTIEFHLHRIENKVEFKIKNTGEGILATDLPHVFERFYKIDKSRSNHKDSLGLGLYICKTICELHNGTISVNSAVGEYTEFIVVLPVSDKQ